MKKIATSTIKIYQKTISPDHSYIGSLFPFLKCRFYPSCSQYAIDAIEKYGTCKGLWLGLKRIARCHPFCEGGIDEVSQKSKVFKVHKVKGKF